jgi:hypothetical protein
VFWQITKFRNGYIAGAFRKGLKNEGCPSSDTEFDKTGPFTFFFPFFVLFEMIFNGNFCYGRACKLNQEGSVLLHAFSNQHMTLCLKHTHAQRNCDKHMVRIKSWFLF